MATFTRFTGSVSQTVLAFFPDATVSTGAGFPNIVASTVRLAWFRSDSTGVSSYLLTTGTLGSFAGSTMTQLGSTSTLGWYQISLPDGLFASGDHAIVHLMSSTAAFAPVPLLFDLSSQVVAVRSPVGVSTLPAVSSISTPVTASSVTRAVDVSSFFGSAAVTSAAGVLGPLAVSSVTDKSGYGVASIATPVSVSSGAVAATTVTIPVGVSTGAVAVTSATAAVYEAAADALLNRNVSSGGNAGRLVKEAFYAIRNRVDLSTGIVYLPDDTTTSWAFAVSTTPGDPVYLISPV